MKVLNTRKLVEPTDDDIEMLRRMIEETLKKDHDGFIILRGVSIEVDADGNLILKRD